jgi:hypothetical protein
MKKLYFNLLALLCCSVMFTSCKIHYKITTSGLPETDSSYLVSRNGVHTPVKKVDVQPDRIIIDGKERSVYDLKGVKYKNRYYSIVNGTIYGTEIYGRVNLLYTMEVGLAQNSNNAGSHSVVFKNDFLYKTDSTEVVEATKLNYYDYLSDNEKALRRIHGSYNWSHVRTGSTIAFGAGVLGLFGGLLYTATHNSPGNDNTAGIIGGSGLALAGVSIPTFIIAHIMSTHKAKKAIKIYNR